MKFPTDTHVLSSLCYTTLFVTLLFGCRLFAIWAVGGWITTTIGFAGITGCITRFTRVFRTAIFRTFWNVTTIILHTVFTYICCISSTILIRPEVVSQVQPPFKYTSLLSSASGSSKVYGLCMCRPWIADVASAASLSSSSCSVCRFKSSTLCSSILCSTIIAETHLWLFIPIESLTPAICYELCADIKFRMNKSRFIDSRFLLHYINARTLLFARYRGELRPNISAR